MAVRSARAASTAHHLACPYHLWEFDCRTGEYDRDPSRGVATYPVRIEDGQILIEVP